ncbi:hypothetical protein [Pseudomonas luteola]|uniref:hypothetical protein n=1 Tax=Pseudomonas luteola TaxID=47886 RepID=UPI00123B64A8|nr:hypothetical protein [Pseudomonas luteola]QEU29352.1 hypothetical protein FOB45_16920 [Pseudomonas luteola]
MSPYEALTLLASVLAIAVSTVSLVRSRKLAEEQAKQSKEQLRLAEEQLKLDQITAELSKFQMRELEEQQRLKTKPNIQVRINKLGNQSHFVIANNGQGSAYDVDMELIECPDNPLMDTKYKLPHPELKPKTTINLLAAFHLTSPHKYQAKVTWRDTDGEHSEIFWLSK